jgi:hypothetical protein
MNFLNDLFSSKEKQNLITNLSPKKCFELLQKNAKQQTFSDFLFPMFKEQAVVVSFNRDGFKLWRRTRFQSIYYVIPYYGKFVSKGKGTRIEGYFENFFVPSNPYEMPSIQKDYILRFLIKTLDANVLEESDK